MTVSYKTMMLNKTLGEFQPIIECTCHSGCDEHAPDCKVKNGKTI